MLTLAAVALALLLTPPSWGQTTISNLTVALDANALRDRLYDASTATALQRAPIHAAVLHLMDEALRKNPAALSAQDALDVMQNAIRAMTNDIGNASELNVQNLTSAALPYLQKELSKKLPPATVNTIQTGWSILTVAEQQGLFSSVYSNLTTAFPSGSVFSDVQNVASGIETLRREAASRVAALALPERIRTASDQAFRDAAGQLMSEVTSVKPDDALDSIAQSIPAFRNNPLVQKLAQDAQTAKQAVVDFNTLITSFTNVLNSLHQSVATNANLLGQIAGQQSDIIGSDTNSQSVADSKNLAQQISADISANVDLAENSVTLISTLFKIGGDAKTAQQIATVGGTAIKVANTVGSLAKNVGNLADVFKDKGVFSFASAAATGNLIGAVLDVFSLFGPSEPSPDEVILNQIDAVRQDIANLSEQMNSRFDRVDAALTNIMDKLDYNLSVINTDFTYVANNLDQIRSSLFDLQGQVQRLEWQTYSYLTVLGDQDLQLALNGGLAHEQTYHGSPLDFAGFQTYENTFYTWAYNFSSDDLREPVPVNCPSCYSTAGLYDQLTAPTAPEQSVGYVNNFIHNTLGLPMPFSGASALANPRVWSITANAYSQLCLENPAWFRQTASYRLNNIIQVGNNLNTFLNRLVAFNTNAPNTNLWLAACDAYRSAVQDFTTALHTSLSLYYSTNSSGLGAGFNPFTNQFLSLVTPQSATMRDGYYANASVVSVTAITCSPTPDGRPIYFLDQNTLRRLDTNGMITTVAGRTNAGFGSLTNGLFNNPQGLAVGTNGLVYVADTGNHAIRVVGPDGLIRTLAGGWRKVGVVGIIAPRSGAVDGTYTNAYFNSPRALIIDTNGDLLVADTGNHAIRMVTPAGVVTTFAGTLGMGGFRDGSTVAAAQGTNAHIAQFWTPDGMARGTNGVIYVTDGINRSVKLVSTDGRVSTYNGLLEPLPFLLPQSLAQDWLTILSPAFKTYVAQIAAGGSASVNTEWETGEGPSRYVDYSLELLGNSTVAACGAYNALSLGREGSHAYYLFSTATPMAVPAGLSNVVAIASGGMHALALKADGTVIAWGDNFGGECNIPAALSNVVAIAAGSVHSLALRKDGTVVAWGGNDFGQCNVPAGLTNAVAVSAGGYETGGDVQDFGVGIGNGHSLALKADGTVVAWGDNSSGQCSVPAGLINVVAVAAGNNASVALRGDGTLVGWGSGRLPDWAFFPFDTGVISHMPAGLNNVVSISLGASFASALRSDGTPIVWGTALYPMDPNGNGTITMFDSGVVNGVLNGLNNVAAIGGISSQAIHAAVLKRDGTVVTWGDNTYGERNLPTPSLPPQTLDTLFANAAVQQYTAGAITPDGRLLVADKFGLRLFDNSDRYQRQAAAYLVKDMTSSGGDLNRAGNTLKAWHLLLQTLATYALSDALATDDALHALLFGSDCLLDTDSTAVILNNLVTKTDWRPAHLDLGATALQRIDLLQAHLLDAVTQLAQKPNPANLPLVTDTLSRLNLLLATQGTPVPSPALDLVPGTNQTVQLMLNGYPYVHYALQSSPDLQTWTTNSASMKDGSGTSVNTAAAGARFYRALQSQ